MQGSSPTVGPSHDGLRLMLQPYPGHVAWSLMRMTYRGPVTRQARLESGSVPLSAEEMSKMTARGMLLLVLASMKPLAQPPAPPLGDMGEQLTLNLDLTD